MVDYSGSNEIELGNDDVFDEDINVETIGFPTVLPGDMFPEKPDLTNPKAAQNALQEITYTDQASGLGEAGRELTSNLAPGTLYQYPNFGVNTMGGM